MLKVAGSDLEYVADIIEECDGTSKIEELQNHENIEIYKLAYDIIETYFGDDFKEVDSTNAGITERPETYTGDFDQNFKF